MVLLGSKDRPGVAHLTAFHPLLDVGNEVAASCGAYDCVISTVVPVNERGVRDRSLTTHAILFSDKVGRESLADESRARAAFVEGARFVDRAVRQGKRTLVHCSFGQNRSTGICIAYAVLYLQWSTDAAISYVVAQNHRQRRYDRQSPCSNAVFLRLLRSLARPPTSRSTLTGWLAGRPEG